MNKDMVFSMPTPPECDYETHNREASEVWGAFIAGKPSRVLIRLGCTPRVLMLDSRYNTRGLTYEQTFNDPELMWRVYLEFQYWARHFLFTDNGMGLPDKWQMSIDFANTYDAMFFGCEIEFPDGQVPSSKLLLSESQKRLLFDRGLPDPFGNEWMQRLVDYAALFKKKAQNETFMGRPISDAIGCPATGSDGIFTTALNLRDASELLIEMHEDPDYVHQFLDFITDALIERMTAFRRLMGKPLKERSFFMADDAIQMISIEAYREFVLPRHKRLIEHFSENPQRGNVVHLCGDAQRFFPIMHEELGVESFDTGFPVDFAWIRKTLGPDVTISGGPHINYFLEETPDALLAETKRILASGIMEGGKFILQEGNNLPPGVNLNSCRLFYETGKRFGKYQ